ncbi:hypothetical protein ABT354_03620 [Streptomyces sp. NPDC000594]|uniref:hypothetical protein n=1 Tax=Streptomyces sp. NPDC000594 TaxID=3154261 RepID=UPI003316FE07
MTWRRVQVVAVIVCALGGGGLMAGRLWAGAGAPPDLGPGIVVRPTTPPLPDATWRARPSSSMEPASTPPTLLPTLSRPPSPGGFTALTAPPPAREGGRPVRTVPPPRSDDDPPWSPGDDDEESDEGEEGEGSGEDDHEEYEEYEEYGDGGDD